MTEWKQRWWQLSDKIRVIPGGNPDVTLKACAFRPDPDEAKVTKVTSNDMTFDQNCLLALHKNGKVVAFSESNTNGPRGRGHQRDPEISISSPKIRLQNLCTQELFLLMKNHDLRGTLTDLSFAPLTHEVILAAVDHVGNVVVFQIKDHVEQKMVFAICNQNSLEGKYHKIQWSGENDQDLGTLSVTSNAVVNFYRMDKLKGLRVMDAETISGEARKQIVCNTMIEGIIVSPDGLCCALFTQDGSVRFYDLENSPPRVLQEWTPDLAPSPGCMTAKYTWFLNSKCERDFWRFAVTGIDFNTTFKFWDLQSSECLQTVRLLPTSMSTKEIEWNFVADVDPERMFIVLINVCKPMLFLIRLTQESKDEIRIESVKEIGININVKSFKINSTEDENLVRLVCLCQSGMEILTFFLDPNQRKTENTFTAIKPRNATKENPAECEFLIKRPNKEQDLKHISRKPVETELLQKMQLKPIISYRATRLENEESSSSDDDDDFFPRYPSSTITEKIDPNEIILKDSCEKVSPDLYNNSRRKSNDKVITLEKIVEENHENEDQKSQSTEDEKYCPLEKPKDNSSTLDSSEVEDENVGTQTPKSKLLVDDIGTQTPKKKQDDFGTQTPKNKQDEIGTQTPKDKLDDHQDCVRPGDLKKILVELQELKGFRNEMSELVKDTSALKKEMNMMKTEISVSKAEMNKKMEEFTEKCCEAVSKAIRTNVAGHQNCNQRIQKMIETQTQSTTTKIETTVKNVMDECTKLLETKVEKCLNDIKTNFKAEATKELEIVGETNTLLVSEFLQQVGHEVKDQLETSMKESLDQTDLSNNNTLEEDVDDRPEIEKRIDLLLKCQSYERAMELALESQNQSVLLETCQEMDFSSLPTELFFASADEISKILRHQDESFAICVRLLNEILSHVDRTNPEAKRRLKKIAKRLQRRMLKAGSHEEGEIILSLIHRVKEG